MALIKCPECGKDVSDTIESCIHCGFVLKKAEERTEQQEQSQIELQKDCNEIVDSTDNSSVTPVPKSSIFKFIIWSIVAIAIFFFFIVAIAPKPVTGNNADTEVQTNSTMAIDLNTVRSELLSNEFATQEKYENRRYKVTNIAVVDEIRENYIVVLIPNDYSTLYVQLRYKSSELDFVRQLKKYDYVSFEGTLTELRTGGLWMYFEKVVFIDKLETQS